MIHRLSTDDLIPITKAIGSLSPATGVIHSQAVHLGRQPSTRREALEQRQALSSRAGGRGLQDGRSRWAQGQSLTRMAAGQETVPGGSPASGRCPPSTVGHGAGQADPTPTLVLRQAGLNPSIGA